MSSDRSFWAASVPETGTDSAQTAQVTPAAAMATYWERLVAVAMLGTDRRNPPEPPDPIADLVADTVAADPSRRMLTQVAAAVAVRRAGVLPAPAIAPLLGPEPDDRPPVLPTAVGRWYALVNRWPVLEDEWMIAVIERGWRLAPEMVPDALIRHRSDPLRRARTVVAAGPIADWLTATLPHLAPPPTTNARTSAPAGPSVPAGTSTSATSSAPGVDLAALTTPPELPIPGDLRRMVDRPGPAAGKALAAAIGSGALVHAHRAVLVNVVARVRPDALADIARHLDALGPHPLAAPLADLATTRDAMLTDLA